MHHHVEQGSKVGVSLVTERLTLSWPDLSNLREMVALWGDVEVVRYIGGTPFLAEDVWQRLLRYRGHWALLGYGYWIIRERATGDFVGEIGFANWHRTGLPELTGRPEGGWVLSPAMQGRGYAREALNAALAWLDQTIDASCSTCIIAPDNAASLRLAMQCGYHIVRHAFYRGNETCVLVRDRPEHGRL